MIKSIDNITVEQAKKIIESVELLLKSLGAFFNENSNQPAPGCKSITESQEFSDSELVDTAYAQAGTLIEVAADHLSALTRVLQEPVQTIAPYNCVRAVLETSAIAAWILDPSLDARSRVSRSFAFRYEGLEQQLKFVRAWNEKELIDKAKERIEYVEKKASALGFKSVPSKKGCRIAEKMPSNVDVIRDVLDEEVNYRLLSAMTHGHHWAYLQLGFRVIPDGEHGFLEKNLETIYIVYLCSIAVNAFLKPVRSLTQLYGWDSDRLDEAVQGVSEILSLPDFFKPRRI
ncbi:MAG: hypothetical protein JXJ17_12125 [Anaerolineae bacterium]|nr:hypothetical protein [Anaerolineae bacterium]